MHNVIRRLSATVLVVRRGVSSADGQDLIEYALIAALIGFGAVTASKTLANSVGVGLGNVGNNVTTYTS